MTDLLEILNLGPSPLRMALLRHDLPDKSHHLDWMIARSSDAGAKLLTFRLAESLAAAVLNQVLAAEQIADHRHEYLSYEGPISGDRGAVSRVASGEVEAWHVEENRGTAVLTLVWMGNESRIRQSIVLEPKNLPRWEIFVLASGRDFGHNG